VAHETTKVVRKGLERICHDFSGRVRELGFERTRKMLWTRAGALTIDFVHFHRQGSTYGAAINCSVGIRVHFGIRVINDNFPAPALNGPSSDAEVSRAGRYHLRFHAETGSTYDRCLEDLVRIVVEQGEPWFRRFSTVDALLSPTEAPLSSSAMELLALASAGKGDVAHRAASLKVFGLD